MVFVGCKKDDTPRPSVNSNEVGFVNETSFSADWGIRYAGNVVEVKKNSTSILPYSNDGYWVSAYEASDILYVSPSGGQVIVLYEDGDYYKLRVE